MGVDYSAHLFVGVPVTSLISFKMVKKEETRYNPYTGEPHQITLHSMIMNVGDKQIQNTNYINQESFPNDKQILRALRDFYLFWEHEYSKEYGFEITAPMYDTPVSEWFVGRTIARSTNFTGTIEITDNSIQRITNDVSQKLKNLGCKDLIPTVRLWVECN